MSDKKQPVVFVRRSRTSLRAERRELLAEVGMTGTELRRRARRDELVGGQWDAYERLREVDFLLGRLG